MKGSCYIQKCAPGYRLAIDNSMCMDEETVGKFITIGKQGWENYIPSRLN